MQMIPLLFAMATGSTHAVDLRQNWSTTTERQYAFTA